MGSGFSHQSVPSLSKTATRASGGTYPGPPIRVTDPPTSTRARRAARSLQLGSGVSLDIVSTPASSSASLLGGNETFVAARVDTRGAVAADSARHDRHRHRPRATPRHRGPAHL